VPPLESFPVFTPDTYESKAPLTPEEIEAASQKVDKTKYKTEMCKNWIEVGVCRYGNKCQFAHGDLELLGKAPPVNNMKYKSKTCTTF
jgi:Zinc finger domain